MSIIKSNSQKSTSFQEASGTIEFKMTNDYMFRAILQQNNKVLKGLISALIHLKPEDITEITITNPIEMGRDIDNKEFILDIVVCVNNNTFLNLEMQVVNELNWPNRSLSYLCRTFDQLYQGQEYNAAKPVIHIGILDFQPFKDNVEFYATYKLMNVKNQHLYTSNFMLRMIDLTHVALATDEDKEYHIDYWAKLFKATTWEGIKMIAEKNEYISEAAQTLYKLNADEIVRQQCRARDDYYKLQRTIHKALDDAHAEKDAAVEKLEQILGEKDAAVEKLEVVTEERNRLAKENVQMLAELQRLQSLVEKKE